MRLFIILTLLAFSCGQKTKDGVDEYDRLDLGNTIPSRIGAYNPKVYSTYIFPADSSDIVTVTDTSDYKIRSIIFPVRNKYVTAFVESLGRKDKVKYREYKLQVEITDHEGLYIKKIMSKYDLPDSILKAENCFIREAKFRRLENNEFQFDLRVCFYDDSCQTANVKYFVHLADGIRFEKYPDISYDSTLEEPEWDY